MRSVVIVPPPSVFGRIYTGPPWLGWLELGLIGLCALAVLVMAVGALMRKVRR